MSRLQNPTAAAQIVTGSPMLAGPDVTSAHERSHGSAQHARWLIDKLQSCFHMPLMKAVGRLWTPVIAAHASTVGEKAENLQQVPDITMHIMHHDFLSNYQFTGPSWRTMGRLQALAIAPRSRGENGISAARKGIKHKVHSMHYDFPNSSRCFPQAPDGGQRGGCRRPPQRRAPTQQRR